MFDLAVDSGLVFGRFPAGRAFRYNLLIAFAALHQLKGFPLQSLTQNNIVIYKINVSPALGPEAS